MTVDPIVVIQGLWAIVLAFVGVTMKRISADIEENNKSIHSLAEKLGKLHIEMLQGFAPKPDFDNIRKRMHDMSNDVSVLMAQAGMEPHNGDD